MRAIQYGDADLIIAGGGEMSTTRLGIGGFSQAKALSQRNESPSEASRPWDRDRDGFVASDGGGAMLLEELEFAKARGARIYAELVGFGMSADAHHITAPPENGGGAALAMRKRAAGRADRPVGRAIFERPRHLNHARRPRGDGGHQTDFWCPCRSTCRELDQVHDRSPARCSGCRRGRTQRVGPAGPSCAADDQFAQSGPRMRPRLRAAYKS